jgi:inositol oxygenase
MDTSDPSASLDSKSNPLGGFDDWETFMEKRYPESLPAEAAVEGDRRTLKTREGYRDYRAEARACVKDFYRQNHHLQTVELVRAKQAEFGRLDRGEMSVWDAIARLDTIVDDSDPDTENSQLMHALQSGEAAREAGMPRWFILTSFLHDLGKILCVYGEPQWSVVGDTFPVGCRFSEKIVFSEFFEGNPDSRDSRYNTEHGIYEPGCGLEKVLMSWGHDEYLYYVLRPYLPEASHYIIRYHSFYPWHREGEYGWMLTDKDRAMLKWVKAFNPFDLYSKKDDRPNVDKLMPFYRELVAEYLPGKIRW